MPSRLADAAADVLQGSSHAEQEVELSARCQQQQQPARPSVIQSAFAAAMSAESDGFLDPASTQTSSSPADSRYTSRQSSLKTLLPGARLTKSSSQHVNSHTVTFTADAGTGCLEDEESGFAGRTVAAADAPPEHSNRSTRSSGTGFAGHLKRIGSIRNWKASRGYGGLEQQQEWQQRQHQHKQHKAAVAAAAVAAEKLGADVEWWAFKTGDPLLDRHVVQVDVAEDLAWEDAEGKLLLSA